MFSERLKELRKSYKLSQVELGNKLRVTKQCVSNWENDNIQPSIEMLIKIATFFNVTTDYLLGLTSSKTIDITGLNDTQAAHIACLIEDIKECNKKINSQ